MVEAKTVFVYFVRFVKLVTVLTLLAYGVVCGLACRNSVESVTTDNKGKAFAVLAQIGYIVFIIALIIAEFGFKWFERGIYVLHFWLGRGLFLGWIGIQAGNEAEQLVAVVTGATPDIDPQTLKTTYDVVVWQLIAIGMLYVIMSLMCLQKLIGLDRIEDVDSGFSNIQGGSGSADGTSDGRRMSSLSVPLSADKGGADEEDAKLLQNAASALGMTVRELRNRLSGNSGTREAQRMFDERQRMLTNALRQAPPEGKRAVQQGGANTLEQPASASNASALEPPAHVVDVRKGSVDDDDDLEARYYASMAQQQ